MVFKIAVTWFIQNTYQCKVLITTIINVTVTQKYTITGNVGNILIRLWLVFHGVPSLIRALKRGYHKPPVRIQKHLKK